MPPCVHYVADRCGGCQLMHLSPGRQRAVKARIVGDAFRRIAHLDVADPDVMPRPRRLRLSHQGHVHAALRTHHGVPPGARRRRPFSTCTSASSPTTKCARLHAARPRARVSYLPRDNARVVLRIDRTHVPHVMVLSEPGDAWTGVAAVARRAAAPRDQRSGVVAPGRRPGRASSRAPTRPGRRRCSSRFIRRWVRIVRGAALDALGAVAALQVWDLYAGIGESTVELAARGATVDSVESDTRAVSVAETPGPARATAPRRAGGGSRGQAAQAATDSRESAAHRHGTARDRCRCCGRAPSASPTCHVIRPRWRATSHGWPAPIGSPRLRAFDQFPQTAHVECLAVLERR